MGSDPDADELCGFNHVLGDPVGGQFAVIALLAALSHRFRTGEGQNIDLSMVEAVGTMMGEATMAYEMNGTIMEPKGNRQQFLAPHGIYPCHGDDKWVAIAVETRLEWRSLCEAIGWQDLTDDPTLDNLKARKRRRSEINEAIAGWTRQRTQYEVMELLQARGIAATPCLDQEGRFLDPHLQSRQCYVDVEHPVLGSEPLYGVPYKMSATPGSIRGRAPLLGEHNDEVLGDLLGMPLEKRQELIARKAIY